MGRVYKETVSVNEIRMIAPTQIKKPSNWQDFEKLCKLLWGEIWGCEDSIKRHGRNGQNQHGVDVYANVDKYGGYCGIQCKGKDDYSDAKLSETEIDDEIQKALTFEPELKLLVFATTANKNANIEAYIRKKDIESRKKGKFAVDVFSWEDIVDQLERYKTTYKWYCNNCQFKDNSDVRVTFDGEVEVTIHPEYYKTTTHYALIQPPEDYNGVLAQLKEISRSLQSNTPIWDRPRKIDRRWCKLQISIENTGSTVLKTPKLIVFFREEDIEDISDRFSYFNEPFISDAVKAQINASRDAKREVFQRYSNGIEYIPKDSIVVQKDTRSFTISVKPADGVKSFPLYWQFLCEDYDTDGNLTINVEPSIEARTKTIEVDKEEDLNPDEVVVEPKIVEG